MKEAIYDPDCSLSHEKLWVNMVSRAACFTGVGGGRSLKSLQSLIRLRGGTPWIFYNLSSAGSQMAVYMG